MWCSHFHYTLIFVLVPVRKCEQHRTVRNFQKTNLECLLIGLLLARKKRRNRTHVTCFSTICIYKRFSLFSYKCCFPLPSCSFLDTVHILLRLRVVSVVSMVPYHLESTKKSLHCIALYFMSIYASYLCPSTHDDKNESVLMFLAMLYGCCKRPLVYRLRSSNILVIIVRLLFLNILFVQFISTELYNKGLSPIVLHCKKVFMAQ